VLAQPQQDDLDAGPRQAASGTERFCAATGKVKPVAEMIRFVLAPDGAAVADLKRRLPGRGIWITATRPALQQAVSRKAFARSFRRDVRIAPDFIADTERLLERSALDALAIARKAGSVARAYQGGSPCARQRGRPVAGSGRRPRRKRKLKAALRPVRGADRIPVVDAFLRQLDLALGRSNVIHAALLTGPAAETFLARVTRLERFRIGETAERNDREPLKTGE
jgi:predicted RNA-binding protein YlxR (DUF448 family)